MENGSMKEMKILSGIVGAPGVVVGTAKIIDRSLFQVTGRKIRPEQVDSEIKRFELARKASKVQLREALSKVKRSDHRIIIESHLMLAEDVVLFEGVIEDISERQISAEQAVIHVMESAKEAMDDIEEDFLRERATDIEHVTTRILRNLTGIVQESLETVYIPSIVVARDLSPADMAHADRDVILGIITDVGGSTSHTSILARGMNIPAIVGTESATREIKDGDPIILDAMDGRVLIRPTQEVIDEFREKQRFFKEEAVELLKYKDLPSVTKDSRPVEISANIELPQEAKMVMNTGIRSVGLFRSEFLYLTSSKMPSEDEQFLSYKSVLEQFGKGNPVTIRTLDVGADKVLPGEIFHPEANPALGVRAIRFSIQHPQVFKAQLRALFRASIYGTLRIMFPMICGLGEVRRAKEFVKEVKYELNAEGIPYDEDVKIGIMMEVPSASLMADVLAKEVDFFSIGTNDLIQYMLAVDRVNEHVNYLYTPLHPSVIRVIHEIVRKGHEAGIEVGMCGKMASEIHYTMLLVGLDLDVLSMPVYSALKIKRFLRNIKYSEARRFADDILQLSCSADVTQHLQQEMSCRFPTLFPADYWEHEH